MLEVVEIRETQLENLVNGHPGKTAGADRIAGGEHIDEVAIQLGQSPSPDPVRVAWDGLGSVFKRVVVVIVARIAKRYKSCVG